MKKVSVIMPIYNAERYLVNSISSLLSQTLSDIEIILVDDASTDSSNKIIADCKSQFPDKVITLGDGINRGPGGARNLGIQVATGEYIGFIDSDDLAVPEMYEKLYKVAKENDADIVDSGFYSEKNDNAILYTSDELCGNLDGKKRSELIVSGGYIWTKIFKASILKNDANCIFRENAILEDADFLTYIFATANNIYNIKEILYKYSYVKGSESDCDVSEKYHSNIVATVHAIYDKTHNLPNYNEIKEAVEYEMGQMLLYGFINNIQLENQNNPNSKIMKSDLLELKNLINVSCNSNQYILSKFSKDDINLYQSF